MFLFEINVDPCTKGSQEVAQWVQMSCSPFAFSTRHPHCFLFAQGGNGEAGEELSPGSQGAGVKAMRAHPSVVSQEGGIRYLHPFLSSF